MKNKTDWKAIAIVFLIWTIVFTVALVPFDKANAEGLFDGPDIFSNDNSKSGDNSLWKSDGSLVIIKNAEESGYVVKDGEVEYYVVPKEGESTFIYDDSLIICANNYCY
jgi:hypothetical protein